MRAPFLVTGATGQIGTALARELRRHYGVDNVVGASRRAPPPVDCAGPFVALDVCDPDAVGRVVREHRVGTIFHLAAMLSAVGELEPQQAWRTNLGGLHNVLEAARACDVAQVFWPSSIAVFGPDPIFFHTESLMAGWPGCT